MVRGASERINGENPITFSEFLIWLSCEFNGLNDLNVLNHLNAESLVFYATPPVAPG